jgi:hypothetical protein
VVLHDILQGFLFSCHRRLGGRAMIKQEARGMSSQPNTFVMVTSSLLSCQTLPCLPIHVVYCFSNNQLSLFLDGLRRVPEAVCPSCLVCTRRSDDTIWRKAGLILRAGSISFATPMDCCHIACDLESRPCCQNFQTIVRAMIRSISAPSLRWLQNSDSGAHGCTSRAYESSMGYR